MKRAVLRMPFDGGGKTGDEPPAEHGQSYLKGTKFAWDLHASRPHTGVAVKPRFVSSDGSVSLRVTEVKETAAGASVRLTVSVAGIVVGKVRFVHLDRVQVCANSAKVCSQPTPDTVIGYTAPNERVNP